MAARCCWRWTTPRPTTAAGGYPVAPMAGAAAVGAMGGYMYGAHHGKKHKGMKVGVGQSVQLVTLAGWPAAGRGGVACVAWLLGQWGCAEHVV